MNPLYDAALFGDLRPVDAACSDLGWNRALQGAMHFAEPSVFARPAIEDIADIPPVPAAVFVSWGARSAALRLDGQELALWHDAALRLDTNEPLARLHRDVVAWWRCVFSNDAVDVCLEDAFHRARELGRPFLSIECIALRALHRLNGGETDEALVLARRASRMARTEGIPQAEYLANWILARVRRTTGKPHLALHILTSLSRTASSPWRALLAWERVLAGGSADEGSMLPHRLWAALGAARHGQRRQYESSVSSLETSLSLTLLRRDLELVSALCDPMKAAIAGPVGEWCAGRSEPVPHGLYLSSEDLAAARVIAGHGDAPRRFLPLGTGLAPPNASDVSGGTQLRTDTAIAMLLLDGARNEEEFFRALYGFEYEASAHRSMRNVLYHRIRAKVGDAAALERGDDGVALVTRGPIIATDPRSAPSDEQRILNMVAETGGASAKTISSTLNIPGRSVRAALKELTEDGACKAEQVGKSRHYLVEDTTFQEPTKF